ncbi:Mannosylglucosyl-3-phosphoglycerate phosphatase [bacterium HR15]|nr:Mannosylglucosyl-3-phosphoglycerate phosphatase [bacterium HR15]
MSRRRWWWLPGIVVSLFGLTLQLGITVDSQQRWARIVILHTNDTHGHLLPFSYPEGIDPNSQEAQLPYKHDIGGIARRATLLRQLRQQFQGETLVVDCGDFMDGTPFSLHYFGEADITAMNACGYDYATLGNHEFSNSLPQVQKLIRMARFPYVCANARLRATGTPLCHPYLVVERNGLRLALFGLIVRDTQNYRGAREGVEILDPYAVAAQLVPQLRQQADVVILLSHLGIETDMELARRVPGIDVIVGGHSHTRLMQPRFVPWDKPLSKSVMGLNGTVIVQAHQWGGELGRLEIFAYRDRETHRWALVAYKGELIPITRQIPEDPAVTRVVNRYWKPIARQYGRIVGIATDDFVQRGDDLAEYHLVSDAIRAIMGSDFDIQNLYGVRIQLAKGPITYYDLARMLPFGNTVVRFEIKGAQLKQLLEQQRPTCSANLRYRVENGRLVEATLNGEPIRDDALYRGTTNSYFADRYLKPMNIPFVDTGRKRLDVVAEYIRQQKQISPMFDGRRIVR